MNHKIFTCCFAQANLLRSCAHFPAAVYESVHAAKKFKVFDEGHNDGAGWWVAGWQ